MNQKQTDSLIKLLSHTSRKVNKGTHKKLSKHNLYRGQIHVLKILWKNNTGVTQKFIADHLSIQPASMSKMIQRMEANGFIRKEKDENDQRKVHIYPTEKSNEIRDTLELEMKLLDEIAFNNFSVEEKIIFRRLLHQIIDNVSEYENND